MPHWERKTNFLEKGFASVADSVGDVMKLGSIVVGDHIKGLLTTNPLDYRLNAPVEYLGNIGRQLITTAKGLGDVATLGINKDPTNTRIHEFNYRDGINRSRRNRHQIKRNSKKKLRRKSNK